MGDINSTTERGKIQPFLDHICPAFEAAFTPSQQIAIDESVITYKGHDSSRLILVWIRLHTFIYVYVDSRPTILEHHRSFHSDIYMYADSSGAVLEHHHTFHICVDIT